MSSLLDYIKQNKLISNNKLTEIKNNLGYKELRIIKTEVNKEIAHNGIDIENIERVSYEQIERSLIIISEIFFIIYLQITNEHKCFRVLRQFGYFKYLDKPFFNPELIKELRAYFEKEENKMADKIEKSNLPEGKLIISKPQSQ